MKEVELGTLANGDRFRWLAKIQGLQHTVADFIVQGEAFTTAGDRWIATTNTLTGATYHLPASTEVMATSTPAEPQEYDGRQRAFFATPQPEPLPRETPARLAEITAGPLEELADEMEGAGNGGPATLEDVQANLLAQAQAVDAVADAVLKRDAHGLTFAQVFGDEPWPEPTAEQRAKWAEQRFDMLLRDRNAAIIEIQAARKKLAELCEALPTHFDMLADDLQIMGHLNAALRAFGEPPADPKGG